MARDENEACALIRIRPSIQINRIMEHVLDAMDDKRMSWPLHGIYDTLEAEQVRALGPRQRFKCATKGLSRQRFIERQHK